MIGAVDIGGTKIAAAVTDAEARILASEECATEPEREFGDAVARIAAMLERCIGRSGGGALEGIGIGCTGPVDPERGALGEIPFLPKWAGGRLASELSAVFRVGAALENDADAHALGEYEWGVGRGTRRFAMVTFGTGIGCGLILDGRLYRGSGGLHPEIGHHVVAMDGRGCSCGSRGCWESLASGPALSAAYAERYPDAGAMSARDICLAAGRGEGRALAVVEEVAGYIGLGLANIVNFLAPEVIALGGGLMRSAELFRPRMEEALGAACRLVPRASTRVLPSGLGGEAGLLGAASVWRYHERLSKARAR